jgi:hypothetical protein
MNCTNQSMCQCGDKEYHEFSSLTCNAQKNHSQSCSIDFNCRVDKYLECKSETCQCISSFPTWSDGYDKCIVPLSYTGYCYAVSDCDTSKSLSCNGYNGNNNCTCPVNLSNSYCDCTRSIGNEYYWTGTSCTIARGYYQTCTNSLSSYMCKTMTEGTICSGPSPYKCLCPSLQYYRNSTSKCEDQLSNTISCTQTDACRSDLGLSCQVGLCQCDGSIQFWDGTRCVNFYTYNTETCSNDNQCKGTLVCVSGGTTCNCPLSVSNSKCDCPVRAIGSEYYWNGSDCVLAASYGRTCNSANYTCQTLTELTQCDTSTGLCSCGPYGIWGSTTCIFCATDWYYQRGSCFRGSDNPTKISLLTQAMVPSACYNVATATIADSLTSSDLSWLGSVSYTQDENFYTLSPTCYAYKKSQNVFDNNHNQDHSHGIICEYLLA